jgi:Tfp pilus assembly protein PilX
MDRSNLNRRTIVLALLTVLAVTSCVTAIAAARANRLCRLNHELLEAASAPAPDAVHWLLEEGADPNAAALTCPAEDGLIPWVLPFLAGEPDPIEAPILRAKTQWARNQSEIRDLHVTLALDKRSTSKESTQAQIDRALSRNMQFAHVIDLLREHGVEE